MTSQAYNRKAGGSLTVNNQKHKTNNLHKQLYTLYTTPPKLQLFSTPKQTSINKGRLLMLRKKWRGGGVGGVAELVRMV